MNSRLLNAVLTGVHRAFPFVDADEVDSIMRNHSQALFRLSHSTNFGTACVALSLLYQLSDSRQAVNDRFYRAMYSALLSPELLTTSRAPTFLSLLFKSMKTDVDVRRGAAFSKRLLQVAVSHPHAGFACGAMLLLSELFRVKKHLWDFVLTPAEADDAERIVDAAEDGDAPGREEAGEEAGEGGAGEGDARVSDGPRAYDPRKRDPGFCNADTTCEWELCILSKHMHPSVGAFARALLAGQHIRYDGDPLRDMALTPFLDKFLARKPKQLKGRGKDHAKSIHRPQASRAAASRADILQAGGEFAMLSEREVEVDDVAFHRFYVARAGGAGAAASARAQKRQAKAAERERGEDPFLKAGADPEEDEDDADDGGDGFDDDGDGFGGDLALDEFAGFSDDEDAIDAILDKDEDHRLTDVNVLVKGTPAPGERARNGGGDGGGQRRRAKKRRAAASR